MQAKWPVIELQVIAQQLLVQRNPRNQPSSWHLGCAHFEIDNWQSCSSNWFLCKCCFAHYLSIWSSWSLVAKKTLLIDWLASFASLSHAAWHSCHTVPTSGLGLVISGVEQRGWSCSTTAAAEEETDRWKRAWADCPDLGWNCAASRFDICQLHSSAIFFLFKGV